MSPLLAFGRFEIGRLLRSWKFLAITVGFPVVFYMLFLGDHRAGEIVDGTVPWRVYLMVAMCTFGSLVAGLTAGGGRLSAERLAGWSRQLRVTPLPSWSYVAVKVTATMLVVLPVLVLVEVVGASFGGVREPAGTWVALTLLMWLVALPSALVGVLIGLLVHPETAFPVVTGLMFLIGYFGGLFGPVDRMPHGLQVVARVLPSYHQASLGQSLLGGRGFHAGSWLVVAGYAVGLALAVLVVHRIDERRGLA